MTQSDNRKPRKRFVRKTKSVRQREIIDATVELIGRYGVRGTTVSRIAEAAGISRGALYQHFPNREAVLEAAINVMDERSSAWIAEAEGDNPTADLLHMAQAHSSWSQSEYNTFVRPFFQLLASHRESNLHEMVLARHKRDLQKLVKRVEEGQRQGTITSEVAATDVAWSQIILAWAEDVALLMGADELITQGASRRIAERLLRAYTLPPAAPGHDTSGRETA